MSPLASELRKVWRPLVATLVFVQAAGAGCGCGCGCTTADGADSAVVLPPPFEAVTATRNVAPRSTLPSRYDEPAAPATATHPAPAESQRRHSQAYPLGSPDHTPIPAESAPPTTAAPETDGGDTLTGAVAGAAATGGVASERAVVKPYLYDAVTATRSVVSFWPGAAA